MLTVLHQNSCSRHSLCQNCVHPKTMKEEVQHHTEIGDTEKEGGSQVEGEEK